MDDYKPVFVGECVHCNKKIHTFDNPDYMWLDEAAFIEQSSKDMCYIVGGYGSTTMDMTKAIFEDSSLKEKCLSIMKERNVKVLYICDDCIKKLLKEEKIKITQEYIF